MTESLTFDAMHLSDDVRRAIDAMGYVSPTPVQLAVFDAVARGRNLVVQARTGTGKTAAFGLPIIDVLVKKDVPKVQALTLCPTRELALQVSAELERIAQFRGVRVVTLYGGASMSKQIEALEAGAQIVVGTPGRVLDHLGRRTLDPSAIHVLVLDEADEMLSMGFARELHAILDLLPKERQTLLFSATIPPDIERLAAQRLEDPEFVTLSGDQVGALEIAHFVYLVTGTDKRQELIRIIEVENPESAIVFCNTKAETEALAEALGNKGFDAAWLNGDLEQREREAVMAKTREGKLRFLVATDVAARGIDISHLTHVINFDFPEAAEAYVHRTGRTGRAGLTGTAISLVCPKDVGALYMVRLAYKIRPIEKQLPSAQELRTRAEADLVQVFVEAFGGRDVHPDDLAVARRLMTHDAGERVLGAMIREHLGARPREEQARSAAEARRAHNPRPVEPEVVATSPRTEPPPRPAERAARAQTPRPAERGPRPAERARRPEDRARRPVERAARPEQNELSELPSFTEGAVAPTPARRSPPDEEGMARIFVNVGRRDSVRAEDLQRLLVDNAGLERKDTGRISVHDHNTFVHVPEQCVDRAIEALAGKIVGGRTLIAERARPKSG